MERDGFSLKFLYLNQLYYTIDWINLSYSVIALVAEFVSLSLERYFSDILSVSGIF